MIDLYTSNASERERRATERVARATKAALGTVEGNCYPAAEALYHLLGGRAGGYKPMVMECWGVRRGRLHKTHWFVVRVPPEGDRPGVVLDPTTDQFVPGRFTCEDYDRRGRGCGFLTREPSKRARAILDRLEDEMEVGA